MYLSDVTIQKYLDDGTISIEPSVKQADIRPAGIRLHLANKILVPKPGLVDLSNPSELEYETIDITTSGYVLEPNAFILGSTIEKIKMARNLVAFVDGRSTIARLGMTIHVTSSAIDGNYTNPGTVTLEIKNLGVHSIHLHEYDALGQFMFAKLSDDIAQESQSQYAHQDGALPPNLAFRPGIDT